jgi:hypothetical protein
MSHLNGERIICKIVEKLMVFRGQVGGPELGFVIRNQ